MKNLLIGRKARAARRPAKKKGTPVSRRVIPMELREKLFAALTVEETGELRNNHFEGSNMHKWFRGKIISSVHDEKYLTVMRELLERRKRLIEIALERLDLYNASITDTAQNSEASAQE